MAWKAPKLDWADGEYFNVISDYNRIKGNVDYLRGIATSIWPDIVIPKLQSFDPRGYPKAKFFQLICDAITAILKKANFEGVQPMRSYSGNDRVWAARDLNAIESNLLIIYNAFTSEKSLRTFGFSSPIYADNEKMDTLMNDDNNWADPLLAYYFTVYRKENEMDISAYLSVGDIISSPNSEYGAIDWIVAEFDDAGKATLLAKNVIDVLAFDAAEPNNYTDPNANTSGCSRYSMSNICQWLNRNAPAGEWFTSQNVDDDVRIDTPPSTLYVSTSDVAYQSKPGFLFGFDARFISALESTSKTTSYRLGDEQVSAVKGAGNSTYPCKMYLLSASETNLDTSSETEGTPLTYFTDSSDPNIANALDGNGVARSWWTRSQDSTGEYVRAVNAGGSDLVDTSAFKGAGIRPACVI